MYTAPYLLAQAAVTSTLNHMAGMREELKEQQQFPVDIINSKDNAAMKVGIAEQSLKPDDTKS